MKTTKGGLIVPEGFIISDTGEVVQIPTGAEVRAVQDQVTIRTDTGYYMPYPYRNIHPRGLLEDSASQCALWFFMQCADRAIEKLPKQISLETDQDSAADLKAMAASIAKCYATTIEEMFESANWKRAQAEVERLNGIISDKLISFINSGGKLHRFHDREPN